MTSTSGGEVRTIKASEFKAKCLALMDEVAESGEEIVITKRGKQVAKLTPCRDIPTTLFGAGGPIRSRGAPWGRYRDIIQIQGDIISPVDVEWEAESDPDRVLNP